MSNQVTVTFRCKKHRTTQKNCAACEVVEGITKAANPRWWIENRLPSVFMDTLVRPTSLEVKAVR